MSNNDIRRIKEQEKRTKELKERGTPEGKKALVNMVFGYEYLLVGGGRHGEKIRIQHDEDDPPMEYYFKDGECYLYRTIGDKGYYFARGDE